MVIAGCTSTPAPGPTATGTAAVSYCLVQGVAVGPGTSSTERVSAVVSYDSRAGSEAQAYVIDEPYSSQFTWVTPLESVDQAAVVAALARQGVTITATPTGGARTTDEAIRDRRSTGHRLVGFTHATEVKRPLAVTCQAGPDVTGSVTVFTSPQTSSFYCDATEGLGKLEEKIAKDYC
jgi:hypothetical protein